MPSRMFMVRERTMWRRGWDSNPRGGVKPPSRFRVGPVTTTSVPLPVTSSPLSKERSQQRPGLLIKDSRRYLDLVVEPAVSQELVEGIDRPRLGIRCPVKEPGHPRLDNRPRAHRAGLDGHVQIGPNEPVVSDPFRRPSEGDNFRVGRGVRRADDPIAPPSRLSPHRARSPPRRVPLRGPAPFRPAGVPGAYMRYDRRENQAA